MPVELLTSKWSGSVFEVNIGATAAEGGSRSKVIKIGGEKGLPFLNKEAQNPNLPLVAIEVWDTEPDDWPEVLREPYSDVIASPIDWAQKAEQIYKADLLCLRLQGIHPDGKNSSVDDTLKLVDNLRKKITLPLIILGCGDNTKDNEVLVKVSEHLKGERCLFGDVVQDNYKTIALSILADGHNLITESPIDINIAKQLNILVSDLGLPLERIVMNPTIGALGYGLEYAYSIMERARLAALGGDKMLAMPFVCFVGYESWRAKESKAPESEFPQWGAAKERGPIWEAVTGLSCLLAGADLLIMRHPKAVDMIRESISELTNTKE